RGPLLAIASLLIIPSLVVAVNTPSLYVSLGAFSVAAAANCACLAMLWALPLDLFPKQQVAVSSGIMLTCGSVAGILAPILMGIILDKTNSFNGSYYTFAVMSLISAVLAAWITSKEKKIKPVSSRQGA
ncbi:MAG: MFS transporter, partial [Alicyclobacillaceae bacterium]|nr:MFS transporter [Alicyclobacillaceae bacterium]